MPAAAKSIFQKHLDLFIAVRLDKRIGLQINECSNFFAHEDAFIMNKLNSKRV